jgi:deoxycytidine triphosphate deaminase/intein/homing endonuclease/transcriptional regulator with XRE-family HTH domain
MVLSDRSIREELAAGRIVIEPLDPSSIQPSSVDLHVDRYFRVFRNHTMGYIDVKQDQEDLTELVEVGEEDVFILHPGEFVLGSTAERVALPDDLVARLEGKSSLGRLGLLIHSSLPAGERVLVLDDQGLLPRPIEEIVRKRIEGKVVAFDPDTFEIGYHQITGWYEGPADRIFEVRLASGRSVRVTAGHNLFTLDDGGHLRKVRTGELRPGVHVAIPRAIPDPPDGPTSVSVLDLAPEAAYAELTLQGPTAARAFREHGRTVRSALLGQGFKHVDYYAEREALPLSVARLVPGVIATAGLSDRVAVRGARAGIPAVIPVTSEFAWLLGLFVAEGCRRRNQVTISNTTPGILDRAENALGALGVPVYRWLGGVTALSGIFSKLIDWLDAGVGARSKKVPAIVFGWPASILEAFLEGFIDGDGSRERTRTSLWSSSSRLVDDLLYLAARRGWRASASFRGRDGRHLYQVSVPLREHKLLTAVPLPSSVLVQLRRETGLTQAEASRALGYKRASDLNNIERGHGRDAVRLQTLRRLLNLYGGHRPDPVALARLRRLTEGGLLWDRVVDVEDTGSAEPIFDLEVRPGGRPIENFLAGTGGVFVSNTAGFVDAGWDGHLTLELSNVANLPITLYPGMKIGQISFLRMTTAAEAPYGSSGVGSKYQGQRGPTPSRYFENFRPRG